MSGLGRLACHEAKTGKPIWHVDTLEKFKGRNIRWGIAESPLIDGEKVICTPGGQDATMVALNKMTGATIWTTKGLSQASAYCSPILVERGGTRLLLTMVEKSIIGVDADSGKVQWTVPHEVSYDIQAVSPAYKDGLVYVTNGYRHGSHGFQLSPDGTSVEEAEAFSRSCGGTVQSFPDTFNLAREELPKEKVMIAQKRIKDGKIVEPVDDKDQCPVCQMYPARYPKNRCQLTTSDKTIHHFCSTQCLFQFLKDSKKFVNKDVKPMMIWVTDYPSGSWISAKSAYYLVGSRAQGPMGYEALAFDKSSEALSLSRQEGGNVITFPEVSIEKIKPKE